MDENLIIVNPCIAGRIVIGQSKQHICPGIAHRKYCTGKYRNGDGCLDATGRTIPLRYNHAADWRRVGNPDSARYRPASKDIFVTATFNQEAHRTVDWIVVETKAIDLHPAVSEIFAIDVQCEHRLVSLIRERPCYVINSNGDSGIVVCDGDKLSGGHR